MLVPSTPLRVANNTLGLILDFKMFSLNAVDTDIFQLGVGINFIEHLYGAFRLFAIVSNVPQDIKTCG